MSHLLKNNTISSLLKERVHKTPDDIAFKEKSHTGIWNTLTWREFYRQTLQLASGLNTCGVKQGDQLAILMPNSVYWEIIQQAAYLLGCVVVGLDENDPPERLRRIIGLSDIKILMIENSSVLKKFPEDFIQSLTCIVVNKENQEKHHINKLHVFPDIIKGDAYVPLPEIKENLPATLLFTSGTTGAPKAVLYYHDQLVTAVHAIIDQIPPLPDQAHAACWLPLANPFQRMINLCGVVKNWQCFMVPEPTSIMTMVGDIQPHFLAAVPRFYEKVHETIQQKTESLPSPLKKGLRWAKQTGMAYRQAERKGLRPDLSLKLRYLLADLIILRQFRKLLGQNIRYYISGSAPMPKELLEKFHAMGWLILESYGVSENIIPMSMSTPKNYRFGTTGLPLAKNKIKISLNGEILVKGPGVSRHSPSLSEDGYLKTGDMGAIDKNGYLLISGRKADGFKLSTGRKIAPSLIESTLKSIEEVDYAIIDGRNQKYLVALLIIPLEKWKGLMERHGSDLSAKRYLNRCIDSVCTDLPYYYRPVRFTIITRPFTPQTGELTCNLKVKRAFVLEKYQTTIEELFKKQKEYIS